MDFLHQNGVAKGISKSIVEGIVKDKAYYKETAVAFGQQPKDGEDGKFIYHFNTHPRSAPKLKEDGSVDYMDMQCFEDVKKDQLIAEYQEPTLGTDGFTVRGEHIEAKHGRKIPPLRGKHIYMNEQQNQFFSDVDGKISLEDNGFVKIEDVYNVMGDVDASTGNITFKGNVEISGNVCSGFKVEATGSVMVNGQVEAATIKAGKDVIIRRGMIGNGRGFIIAGGNVEGTFFEQANIECKGYVHANSIMNSYVDCNDTVEVSGKRGVLLAGRIRALRGIKAVNIGNEAQIPTYIKVGLEPKMRQRLEVLKKSIHTCVQDIEKIQKAQETMTGMEVPKDKKQQMEEYKLRIMRTKITKNTELEKYREEMQELEAQIEAGRKAEVFVEHCAYAGCSVTINGVTNNVQESIMSVTFSLRKGNVIMTYNA
jgi:hypothetical protein